jgi:hypothetical protein
VQQPSEENAMKKIIEPVALSTTAELATSDLAATTGGMPGRYDGHVQGGRQRDPAPRYGHGRDRGERPAQPVDGPNRPYEPRGDGLLPPTRGDGRSLREDQRSTYGQF